MPAATKYAPAKTDTPTNSEPNADIAIAYLRVSTKRQLQTAADVDEDGNSIATQREWVTSKAGKLGVAIEKEFVEPGTSAQTIEKRPVFKELLQYLQNHHNVKYVVIYMRSRAFRNLGDAVLTKRALEKIGVKLVSAKEDFGEGIMADAMEAVTDIINEVQVRMSGEDIKEKMRHKAERGGTNGRARIGYRNIRIDHEGRQVNTIGLDEERAPLVRKAFELYATGDYSIDRLYDTMADAGLTTRATSRWPIQPVSVSKLHRMLRDVYYTGAVPYKGDVFTGRHEAIISQELFDAVQQVMDARSQRGQRDRVLFHYLKGALWCGRCDEQGRSSRVIYTETTGRGGRYAYFKCLNKQDCSCDLPHLPADQVEQAIIEHYGTLGLSDEFTAGLETDITAVLEDAQTSTRELHTSLKAQLAKLDVQEEKLLDALLDDKLPKAKIHDRLRRIQLDRAAAERGLRETGDQLAVGAEILRRFLTLLGDPKALYERAPDEARRILNTAFYEQLFVDDQLGRGPVVTDDTKTALVDDIHQAAMRFNGQTDGTDTKRRRVTTASPSVTRAGLLRDHQVGGLSKTALVGMTGFEPATP